MHNLDTQKLVALIKSKFGEQNISLKTIKSKAEKGINQEWAQKGEIKAAYKGNEFKVLFNTDYEFSSIIFYNGIANDYYDEFVVLMDAIMEHGASLRYSNGTITEWINDVNLAQKRYETISKMFNVEILCDKLKNQLLTCGNIKNLQISEQPKKFEQQINYKKNYPESVKQI